MMVAGLATSLAVISGVLIISPLLIHNEGENECEDANSIEINGVSDNVLDGFIA